MNIIRAAIERPIAVLAAVILAVLFGLISLKVIPIQLSPDLSRPVIQVTTNWPGAAPAEVEREIINRQEDALKGLESLKSMLGESQDGRGRITLEFAVGTDMDKSLLLVANRLDRVDGYPDEAQEPVLRSSGADDNAIAWFRVSLAEGNTKPIHTFGDFAEDVLAERMERVPGVARVDVYGGGAREMRITVDPTKLSRYGLTVPDVVARLRAANASITGGDVEEGKKRYIVRTDNEFRTPEQIAKVLLRSESSSTAGRVGRVTVGDIADVAFGYKKPIARIRTNGEQALALSVKRETGANVIETVAGLREAAAELSQYALPNAGLELQLLYDETVYINSAVDLVIQNIWVGGALAVVILMIFLRSGRATLVIALAIPVSVIASFVAMAVLGRSLNVISLAGIAFAVGMVVDAAIVVLENIYRLRERGFSVKEAAYRGAQQVWGAIFVSALTTVMVFIPILIMQSDVGQLYRDIAVAISVAVLLSLLVSVTVIPALSQRLLRHNVAESKRMWLPGFDEFGRGFLHAATSYARIVVNNKPLALLIVVAVTVGTAGVTKYFLPKLEYLPQGNQNLIFGFISPPPGYNLGTTTKIAENLETAIKPHLASVTGPESKPGEPPKIERFFFVTFRDLTIVGASAVDGSRAKELESVLSRPVFREPGTYGFMQQRSVFGRGVRGARSIDLDISGPELEDIATVAGNAAYLLSQAMPRSKGNQMRPQPGLELGAPEVRIVPNAVRLADNGISARDLGLTVDAFNDGLRVLEMTVGADRMDLMLKGPDANVFETQGIGNLPVVSPQNGQILPLRSLADVQVTSGPTSIRHVERQRTITLEIKPASDIALGEAIEIIQREVVDKLNAQGLPPGMRMRLSGAADKLDQTWNEMQLDLLLALAIVYLVMAVLFESFIYPLLIMLSVPLATSGGVIGLNLLNIWHFNPLDTLTMLGFVILVGIVVNNAILLVHQTLLHIREEGMPHGEAIVEATRNRIRPIFMSTLTSVFGMLPLVLFPGAGSEIYRGLGSVVTGGLALSALLTLLIVPALLGLVVGFLEANKPQAEGATMPTPAE